MLAGVLNEKSIHKALTLIFTYMSRSHYKIDTSNGNIYYNFLYGLNINGTVNNCTILEIITDVKIKGLYGVDEVISIVSWLNTMSMKITDSNENWKVVRFITTTNESLCEPTFTEKHSISYDMHLKNPLTWQGTPSIFKFLQKSFLKPSQLCKEVAFVTDNHHVQIRCLQHLKLPSKSAEHLLEMKDFKEVILTYTCYVLSCACLMVAIPLHACTLSWNTLAGENVQFLMFSFLLSNMAFLFGIQNSNEGLCFWNSVFIQYFFLCDFSWMSVCLIHLTYMLYSLNVDRNLNSRLSVKTIILFGSCWFWCASCNCGYISFAR